jgi:hypothetical protein
MKCVGMFVGFFPLVLQLNSGLDCLHDSFRFTSVTRSRTVGRAPWTGDQLATMFVVYLPTKFTLVLSIKPKGNIDFMWLPQFYVYYHVHKSMPLDHILSQLNPVHTLRQYFFNIPLNTILLATYRSPT